MVQRTFVPMRRRFSSPGSPMATCYCEDVVAAAGSTRSSKPLPAGTYTFLSDSRTIWPIGSCLPV
jgi:hypothetical protein